MSIEMSTDGPPELLVTPLAQWSGQRQDAHRVRLGDSPTLKVRNVELARELSAEETFGSFDFLLHYLTARGGIPGSIVSRTPGMPADLKSVDAGRMAQALTELATAVAKADTEEVRRDLMPEQFLTSSCAASQYP